VKPRTTRRRAAIAVLAAAAVALPLAAGVGTAGAAPVKLPKKTVGFLQITGASEVAIRIEDGARQAAKLLGWKYVRCDALGDPQKMASCGDNLINQRVSVILSDGVEPAVIAVQLKKAKQRKIPWFDVGGQVTPSPYFAAMYAPDDTAMARLLHKYMLAQLPKRGAGQRTIAVQAFDAILALKLRHDQLKRDVKGKHKIVATNQTDFADPAGSVTRATQTVLTANPKLDAIWAATDFDIPAIASVIGQRFPGKTFPQRPLVVGFYGDKANLDAIRKGRADAVVEVPLEATSFTALDAAAAYFAKRTRIDPNLYRNTVFDTPFLITRSNLPAPGRYARPKPGSKGDWVSYYTRKWRAEYRR
jgi:ABC-type sugar transport system substrate-binding protein